MRNFLLASAALSTLALGVAATAVQAAPVASVQAIAQAAPTNVDHVYWRRVCDRDGDRCRRVWIHRRWWRDRD